MIVKILLLIATVGILIFAVRHLFRTMKKIINPPLPEGFGEEETTEEVEE